MPHLVAYSWHQRALICHVHICPLGGAGRARRRRANKVFPAAIKNCRQQFTTEAWPRQCLRVSGNGHLSRTGAPGRWRQNAPPLLTPPTLCQELDSLFNAPQFRNDLYCSGTRAYSHASKKIRHHSHTASYPGQGHCARVLSPSPSARFSIERRRKERAARAKPACSLPLYLPSSPVGAEAGLAVARRFMSH